MPNYERDRSQLGDRGHEVFLRGPDMILRVEDTRGKKADRNFSPGEAIELLEWLYSHRAELYQARRREEGEPRKR